MSCSFQTMKMDTHVKYESMSEDSFGQRSCTLNGSSSTSQRLLSTNDTKGFVCSVCTMLITWKEPRFFSAHTGANACPRTATVMYNKAFDSEHGSVSFLIDCFSFWKCHGYSLCSVQLFSYNDFRKSCILYYMVNY